LLADAWQLPTIPNAVAGSVSSAILLGVMRSALWTALATPCVEPSREADVDAALADFGLAAAAGSAAAAAAKAAERLALDDPLTSLLKKLAEWRRERWSAAAISRLLKRCDESSVELVNRHADDAGLARQLRRWYEAASECSWARINPKSEPA